MSKSKRIRPKFTSTAIIRGHFLKRTYEREGWDERFEYDGEDAIWIKPYGGRNTDFYGFCEGITLRW